MHFGIIDARMYTGNHPDSCVNFFFYWAPDSNPIHTSRHAKQFLRTTPSNGETSPKWPRLWHELKVSCHFGF